MASEFLDLLEGDHRGKLEEVRLVAHLEAGVVALVHTAVLDVDVLKPVVLSQRSDLRLLRAVGLNDNGTEVNLFDSNSVFGHIRMVIG